MCQKFKSAKKHKKTKDVTEIEAMLITPEMKNEFLSTICNTFERSRFESFYHYGGSLGVPISFNTYDHESIEIGFEDGENYILDSDFIFNRFCYRWNKQYGDSQEIYWGDKSSFFHGLYDHSLLTQGIFFDKILYPLSLSCNDNIIAPKKVYFFIPKRLIKVELVDLLAKDFDDIS